MQQVGDAYGGTVEPLVTWQVFRRNPLMFWVAALVVELVAVAGALACGLGVLVTIPIAIAAQAAAYRDHFGIGGLDQRSRRTVAQREVSMPHLECRAVLGIEPDLHHDVAVVDLRTEQLPDRVGLQRRHTTVAAAVDVPDLVHLPPVTQTTTDRRDQTRAILQDAARYPGPVVIAGDFNSRDVVGDVFGGAGFQWVTRDAGHTISFFSWDHVFVRGLTLKAPPRKGIVLNNNGASDHLPVWAELLPQGAVVPVVTNP